MKRRLALWMYRKSLKLEPELPVEIYRYVAHDLLAEQQRQAIEQAARHQAALATHQANVARIAHSN